MEASNKTTGKTNYTNNTWVNVQTIQVTSPIIHTNLRIASDNLLTYIFHYARKKQNLLKAFPA